jgi:hypothetical protein
MDDFGVSAVAVRGGLGVAKATEPALGKTHCPDSHRPCHLKHNGA